MKIGKKVFAAAGAVLLAAVIVLALAGDFRSGSVIMRIESGGSRSWSLSFMRASEGCLHTHTLRMKEGDVLLADVSCEAGEAELQLKQGNTEKTLTFDPDSEPVGIPLDEFRKGRLQLRLTSYGAEELKSRFELIEGR